jgi:Superinfection immunity protein
MGSYLTDQRDRPVTAFVAVVVAFLTAGYMLPWAVATLRGKSNHFAIFWINLLGGWTVVLWIVALVMAFGSHKVISR